MLPGGANSIPRGRYISRLAETCVSESKYALKCSDVVLLGLRH